jgi:glutamate racemase
MKAVQPHHPIGIFDSGVGGLSVLKTVRQVLPDRDLIYIADQAHVPYGERSAEEIRAFSLAMTSYLQAQGAELIIVACNTASAAALDLLRHKHPEMTFVGTEPALKPAAGLTKSGVVGVLATPATFRTDRYASVVTRFASDVTVLTDTCRGLVRQIEAGQLRAQATRAILQRALEPMLAQRADAVVLGCTHYPFVLPLIRELTGPDIRIIDPAPAIARQAARLASTLEPGAGPGQVRLFTTGLPAQFQTLLPQLIDQAYPIDGLVWESDGTLGAA